MSPLCLDGYCMTEKQYWVVEITMDNPSSTRTPPTNSKSQLRQVWNNNNASPANFIDLLRASHKICNMIVVITSSFIEHLDNKNMHKIPQALTHLVIKK